MVHIEIGTRDGVWTLPIVPEDFKCGSWEEIKISQIEKLLLKEYKSLLGGASRVAIAANQRCLRSDETLAVWIHDRATITAQVPLQQEKAVRPERAASPSRMYGLPAVWGPHVAQTHKLYNENMQLQFATLAGEKLQWFQLDTPQVPAQIDISQMEILLRLQFPDKFGGARLTFVDTNGVILKACEQLYTSNAEPVLVVPTYPCGAKGGTAQDYLQASKSLYPQLQGRIDMRQLKLLLRGEPGLLQRCMKHTMHPTKARDLIWETAAKYKMGTATPSKIGERDKAKSKKEQQPSQPNPSPSSALKTESHQRRFQLQEGTWSVPVMRSFILGQSGVHLETDATTALHHAQQLSKTTHTVGLLTIAPIGIHTSVEKITFLLQEHAEGQAVKEKVVTGYLQSYGPHKVEYKGKVYMAERKPMPATTQVMGLYTRKSAH